MNPNRPFEASLLRRCAKSDPNAEGEFLRLSYLNQIYRSAANTNAYFNNALDPDVLQWLCKLLTTEIYLGADVLPHPEINLYERINTYVVAAVRVFITRNEIMK